MGDSISDIKSIFGKAQGVRAPADREAYLKQACGGDARLRAEVESLLQAQEQAGGFFDDLKLPPPATVDAPLAERPGTVIGPYKLLEQIGEGGFGVVFMAEQTEPVRRKVALKILKPGMDTRQVVARFEAERQALAIMDHPNIAKVFDGGSTDRNASGLACAVDRNASGLACAVDRNASGLACAVDRNASGLACADQPTSEAACGTGSGRPYFVMELVKGTRITDFCDQNQLTPRQRLELFLSVCHAVQHAHNKGIIHRDLKPSNVLVSRHDTTPVVKVIDFGVAKALGQELTDKTFFTGVMQMIGTPLYMSPEQAGMSDLDIDTRSDIYTLGVLLYELLTGTTPFDKDRFKHAGYEEIRRIIREEEPPKPSTRLSDLSTPHAPREAGVTRSVTSTLASVAAQRQTEPAKLTKLVKGELDWIVMKALEKDRNRRYETANGFAADVQRYLADEPVQACPPSLGYRLRKFVRRHKGPVLAATFVLAVLVAGIIGTTWGMIRATNAEGVAVAETKEKETALEEKNEALGQVRQRERQVKIDLSNFLLDKALGLCEQGDVHLGMLWLARSLENAPEDSADLQRVIRMNLAGWYKQMSPLKGVLPTKRAVKSIAFTPDGKTVLSASFSPGADLPGEAALWDAATGEPRGLPYSSRFIPALSPDGRIVLTSDEKSDQLQDVASRRPLGPPIVGAHSYRQVAFSADGSTAVTNDDKAIRVWEAATGNLLGKPITYGSDVGHSIGLYAISPDGRVILAGGGYKKDGRHIQEVQLWETNSGNRIGQPLPDPANHSGNTAFSPDGRLLAIAAGKTVKLWEAATGKLWREITPPYNPTGVAFSPDGGLLATWSQTATHLWNICSPTKPSGWHHWLPFSGVTALAFSRYGRILVIGSSDRTVRIWDVVAWQPIGAPLHHPSPVTAVAISPDLRTVATGCEDRALLWDAAARWEPLETWNVPTSDDQGYIEASALNGDGTRLLTVIDRRKPIGGGKEYVVQVWDRATSKPVGSELVFPWGSLFQGITLSADGKTALLTHWEDTKAPKLSLWRGAEWSAVKLPVNEEQRSVVSVALAADGKNALLGNRDGTARLWDLASWQPLGPPLPHQGLDKVALSADGKIALTAGGQEARLWEAATGKPVTRPLVHQGAVTAAVFSADGQTLLTGSTDRTARLWDVRTGRLLCLPFIHDFPVTSVALSPDGRTILTVTTRDLPQPAGLAFAGVGIRVWDVATGKSLGPPIPRYPNSVTFSGDGRAGVVSFQWWVQRWEALPARVEWLVEPLRLWAETITPRELDAAGVAGWQSASSWQQRRQELAGSRPGVNEPIAVHHRPIQWQPRDAVTFNRQGMTFLHLRRLDEAIGEFQKALDLDPNHGAALWNLGALLANGPDPNRRNPRKAIQFAKQAIQRQPGHAGWWQTLGWAYYRSGAWQDSIEALEKSITLEPKNADADQWLFLAMAHWQLDHKQEARKWYDIAVAWIDKNTQALDKQKRNRLVEDVRSFRVEAATLLRIQEKK